MKTCMLITLVILSFIIPGAVADGNTTNATNVTPPDPIQISFMGGHMFGENPVEIFENNNHRVFIGNTSSKTINLSPDYDLYTVRVEPAGISDAANSPDAGLVGAMKWAERNPFGTLAGSTLAAMIIISLKRRR